MVLPERRNAKPTHERPLCAHFLRNTSGYIQRTKFGVGFELICKRFNHSSPSVTMRYLGIEDKEVLEILTHEI